MGVLLQCTIEHSNCRRVKQNSLIRNIIVSGPQSIHFIFTLWHLKKINKNHWICESSHCWFVYHMNSNPLFNHIDIYFLKNVFWNNSMLLWITNTESNRKSACFQVSFDRWRSSEAPTYRMSSKVMSTLEFSIALVFLRTNAAGSDTLLSFASAHWPFRNK